MRNSFVLFAALFMAVCLCFVSCGGAVSNESSVPETPSGSSSEESSIDVSEESSEEPSAPEASVEETSKETSKETSETPLLQKEDVIPVGDSQTEFISDKYPGKRLVRETINRDPYLYPYPFFVIDEELYHIDWNGREALVFNGRYLSRSPFLPIKERSVSAVYYGDNVAFWHDNYKIELLGKLIVISHPGSNGYGIVFFMNTRPVTGAVMWSYEYDDIYENVNSDYVICYNIMFEGFVIPWRVIDLEGNPHSLPVPDECRWSVEEIAFDTESDDPDAVIVKYRENGELKTVKTSLKDTRIVSVDDYYNAVNPDFEWDGDE
ncbi:MAG: hypothetical protein J5760_01975 [Clostridia bacterium]|nr:hypothetical protein [Clostridia bacterium]